MRTHVLDTQRQETHTSRLAFFRSRHRMGITLIALSCNGHFARDE